MTPTRDAWRATRTRTVRPRRATSLRLCAQHDAENAGRVGLEGGQVPARRGPRLNRTVHEHALDLLVRRPALVVVLRPPPARCDLPILHPLMHRLGLALCAVPLVKLGAQRAEHVRPPLLARLAPPVPRRAAQCPWTLSYAPALLFHQPTVTATVSLFCARAARRLDAFKSPRAG